MAGMLAPCDLGVAEMSNNAGGYRHSEVHMGLPPRRCFSASDRSTWACHCSHNKFSVDSICGCERLSSRKQEFASEASKDGHGLGCLGCWFDIIAVHPSACRGLDDLVQNLNVMPIALSGIAVQLRAFGEGGGFQLF